MPAIGTQQGELTRLRAENAALRAELRKYALVLADYERVKAKEREADELIEDAPMIFQANGTDDFLDE